MSNRSIYDVYKALLREHMERTSELDARRDAVQHELDLAGIDYSDMPVNTQLRHVEFATAAAYLEARRQLTMVEEKAVKRGFARGLGRQPFSWIPVAQIKR